MSFTYTKKISTLVLVVVVICISFILVPGVTFASESAIDEALENIEYDASTKAEYIELYLEELDHSISSLAESVVLNGLFLAENTSNMNASIQIINQELAMVSKNHIEFDDIELIDKYGVVLASSNASMIGENRRKSTIFHDGMIDITFHDVIKLNTSSSPVFPISKMIIRNNQIKGLVVIYVNPQYLFQYLSETLVLSKTEETYIVDEDGLLLSPTQSPDDIIYATTVDTLIVQNALHTKYSTDEYPLNPTNPVISYENHRGEKVFGIYRNIHQTDWILLTEQNYDETLSQVYFIIVLYLAITFILILIGLIISFYTSRKLTKPILELRDATKKIGEGFLDTHIKVSTRDEVGDLAQSFRSMTNSLKQSQNEIQLYSEQLEHLVENRTKKLRESEQKLKSYVEKLERNKIALTNIMIDMKETMKAREAAEQDLKKSHQMLQELNEELEQKVQQRTHDIEKLLRQKDEFIHQLGHDLKNPLGPLINLLPILEGHINDEKDKEIITVLTRNVNYMKNLVKNTLELARLNSPRTKLALQPLNLKEEVSDILENNQFLLKEKDMKVITSVPDELHINADKLKLEELLTNLLNNAVKYSYEHGEIIINAENKDDEIVFSIHDHGIGMTKEQLERLFDEFYKADESRHDFDSSGLGMSIAKRIVEKHGGRIWVESDGIGKGSTFYFTLPKNISKYFL
jgi:signal transduction histidine kinase